MLNAKRKRRAMGTHFSNTTMTDKDEQIAMTTVSNETATWICLICGWVYDEQAGDPSSGLAPGTLWADVPDTWLCPDCGVGKAEFEMVQI